MKLIVLTTQQADQVRGRHGKYSALDPILADNGMYVLLVDVMDDPEHKEVLDQLGACKYAEIDTIQVVDAKLPADDPMKITQVLIVKAVIPVIISAEKIMTAKPVYEEVKLMLK